VTTRRYLGRPTIEPGLHTYAQTELAERFRQRLSKLEGTEQIRQMVGFVHEHSSIERRHLEVSLEQIESRQGWYRLVNAATLSLARRALLELIRADLPADRFDALVVVSASHAGFPALSRRLQADLGIRADALCYDLSGLGCAGPTHGLHLADMLLTSGAARRVCVVCADVMGTHGESRVHNQIPNMSQLVAHCLASDGAAAVVVSTEPSADDCISWDNCRLDTRLWPNSLGDNDFTASEDDQPLISVGNAIRTRLIEELGPTVAAANPNTTYFHPGGASLMRQLGAHFPAFAPTLEISNRVLREHGNIGAASILWVLHDAWALHHAGKRELGPELRLIALGPGIVATQLSLTGVECKTS
jgi:predicted naringenin-chalcone synthase